MTDPNDRVDPCNPDAPRGSGSETNRIACCADLKKRAGYGGLYPDGTQGLEFDAMVPDAEGLVPAHSKLGGDLASFPLDVLPAGVLDHLAHASQWKM